MKRQFIASFALAALLAGSAAAGQTGRPTEPVKKGGPIKIGGSSDNGQSSEPIKIGKKDEPKKDTGPNLGTDEQWATEILKLPLNPTVFSWSGTSGKTIMEKVDTHICLLTEIRGNFAGSQDRVNLDQDTGATGGARWVIVGESASKDIYARATCVERVKFVPVKAQVKQLLLPEHVQRICPPAIFVDQPNIKAAGFLSNFSGKMRGGGESVAVIHGPGGPTVRIGGCSGHVLAAQTLLYVPGTLPAKYRSDTARTDEGGKATFGVAANGEGQGWLASMVEGAPLNYSTSTKMVPVDEAFCGLTGISGKMQGGGERASIFAEKENDGRMWWILQIETHTQGDPMAATARCFARDQR